MMTGAVKSHSVLMGLSVKFEGSVVFVDFPVPNLSARDVTRERVGAYDTGALPDYVCGRPFLEGARCVIDSARDKKLLKQIRTQVGRRDEKSGAIVLADAVAVEQPLLKEMVRRYTAQKNKCRRSNEFRRVKLAHHFAENCYDSQVHKRIQKLARMKEVVRMRKAPRQSLRLIAAKLNTSLNVVSDLWRQIRESRGDVLTRLAADTANRILLADFLHQYFLKQMDNADIKTATARQMYANAVTMAGDRYTFSFSRFFACFKRFGFRFDSIRYAPKAAKVIDSWHLRNFARVYVHLLLFHRKFRVIFMDESSICPANFKKKAWKHRRRSSHINSAIKYEKIMLVGALTQRRLAGFQLLHSGFNAATFTNFVAKVVRNEVVSLEPNQQLVLLLDNAPSHRGRDVFDFCRANNIIVLFNLPHMSQLNPIEYFWEYVKRPLRSMVTYKE